MVTYDRETAARFGISPQLIDNTLYDAFGQRQVSTMYKSLNQYHVVMEVAPQYWQNPADPARDLCAARPADGEVPLSAIAHFAPAVAPLSVNHQGLFPCGHHLLQPAAGRGAGRRRAAPSTRPPARSGCRPPFRPGSPAPRRPIRIRSAASRS